MGYVIYDRVRKGYVSNQSVWAMVISNDVCDIDSAKVYKTGAAAKTVIVEIMKRHCSWNEVHAKVAEVERLELEVHEVRIVDKMLEVEDEG
jgi:hypothetical protein